MTCVSVMDFQIGRLLNDLPSIALGGDIGWLGIEKWKAHPQEDAIEEIVEKASLSLMNLWVDCCLGRFF